MGNFSYRHHCQQICHNSQCDGCRGRAACRSRLPPGRKCKAFAAQYNIPHWYASYEELAADPTVDAIYIATPNALHYENCKLCLEHGKHVLCEKPFTINAEQAKELYALAEKKQLFIMEAFWIRFLPAVCQIAADAGGWGDRYAANHHLPIRFYH